MARLVGIMTFVNDHAGKLAVECMMETEDKTKKKMTLAKLELIRAELNKLEGDLLQGQNGLQAE